MSVVKADGEETPTWDAEEISKQYSLRRLAETVLIAAVISGLFAAWPWPVACFVLSVLNVVFSIAAWRWGTGRAYEFATLAAVLIVVGLFRTDWRVSMPNGAPPRPSWTFFIAAAVSQVAAILLWMVRPAGEVKP